MRRSFLPWFRNKSSTLAQAQAHMTFGQSSVGRTVRRTGMFLRKRLWLWPIIAVAILSAGGYFVGRAIDRTMKDGLKSELSTLLSVERAMLEKWFQVQESSAVTLADNAQIRRTVIQILSAEKLSTTGGSSSTLETGAQPTLDELRSRLQDELEPGMSAHDFVGYLVADKKQRIIAAQTPELLGQIVNQFEPFLEKSLEGEPTVSVPFPSLITLKDRTGRMRTETPTMFVCAPVRDDNLQVVAILGMRVRPEREFTEILQLGRMGATGETYAVDKHGLMVSNSRFDEELILSGILPDEEGSASILKVQVRDPGGDLNRGFRPGVRRSELPLTEICAKSLSGSTGVTTEGYRDYQGSLSVGAWTWLPKYQLGLITEMDSAEAFRPLTILNRFFYSLYALLVTGAIAIFVFTLVVARLQREAQKAAVEAKQLGQYRLETRLGAGAMGVVYKGQHAMLRRPTAIKMLQVDKLNEASIERFEREVQITCKLNHPNTIAIYDFGRTPEGVFYYAMEYLDGIDLQTLIERYGPQPQGRVIDILKQVCGSLYEAHSLGLVHRDIKPANIMLNRRGGESDVVKVLDFGLVKALSGEDASRDKGGLSGTPLYMSPESMQSSEAVDGRSDLYAVGAVGYFLLTGQTVFQADSLSELCRQHLSSVPVLPSQRLGTPIAEELENAIMACLDKNPARRPQTARDLSKALTGGMKTPTWTVDDADAWWGRHERELMKDQDAPNLMVNSIGKSSSPPHAGSSSGFDQTIASGVT